MSYAKDFPLTFTQCKQLIANGYDLQDFLESVTTDQPEFIKHMGAIDSISELQAIQQGRCASGAYMPAVTYATALDAMNQHYEEIESILYQHGAEPLTFDHTDETWAGFAVKLVSLAVELWVGEFNLDDVNWD